MTTDNKIDLNAPVTAAEIQERLKDLTPDQLADARRQQIDAAIVNQKSADDPVDWARLNDAQFLAERLKRLGF
jgi:hypothetical protein